MLTINRDLRARFAKARDQAQRPTCLAFALSDAHSADRPPHPPLSADYLYYHSLQRMPKGHGDNGVGLSEAGAALAIEGQPKETAWLYSPILPVPISKWKPPAKVKTLRATVTTIPRDFSSICSAIDLGKPAVIIFRPTERFYYADSAGLLPHRHPDPNIPQLHAVVALGHGKSASHRYLLIRNSWGGSWGQNGYAWLAEDYLSLRLSSVTSVQTS